MRLSIKQKIIIVITLVIAIIISVIIPNFIKAQKSLSTRDINVDEIGTLSYEEKIEKIKSKFSSIENFSDGKNHYFSGNIDIEDVDFLSTGYETSSAVQNYQSVLHDEDETINIKSQLMIDDEVVECEEIHFSTEYDENTDNLYIIDENGEKIDVLECLSEENIEECLALSLIFSAVLVKKLIITAVVVLSATIIISNADKIARDVDTLITGVKDGFISFWDRIKLKCGKITAVMLANSIGILTVSMADTIYKYANKRKDCYLLCGTITGNAPIPIVSKFTNEENARNWIKKGGSIWSPYATSTKKAIKSAGYLPGGINGGKGYSINVYEHHDNDYFVTFNHYHTLNKEQKRVNYSCHAFFGLPY